MSAKPGDPLYDKGMARVNAVDKNITFVDQFRWDVQNGTLPQVSWLVGPAWLSEHASNHPADGEDLSARIINILKENPEFYAKTAFILNYGAWMRCLNCR